MAVAENEMKYASSAVFGSLAYDLRSGAAVPEYEPDYGQEFGPEYGHDLGVLETPETEERQAVHVHSESKRGLRVSLVNVMGLAVAAVLLVFVLLSYVRLTQITDSSANLKNKIGTLEQEQTNLRIKYESVFDLNEIEEYAITALGMVKVDNSQISYLDAGAEDKAVILKEENEGFAGGVETLKGLFDSLKESLS